MPGARIVGTCDFHCAPGEYATACRVMKTAIGHSTAHVAHYTRRLCTEGPQASEDVCFATDESLHTHTHTCLINYHMILPIICTQPVSHSCKGRLPKKMSVSNIDLEDLGLPNDTDDQASKSAILECCTARNASSPSA